MAFDINKPLANEQIKDHKLLLIDNEGKNLGVFSREDALKKANDANLDLVIINQAKDNKHVSVAKIVDFGKHVYELKTKLKKQSQQSSQQIKEITVKPQIAFNDLATHAKKAIAWIEQGHQVLFKIKAFGRAGFMPELIQKVYENFNSLLANQAKIIVPFKKLSPVLYSVTFGKNK